MLTVALLVSSGGFATADEQLVQDVDFLNDIVSRYENARGWFSDRDDAHRIMSRLNYAGGDYGVPLMRGKARVQLVPVLSDEAPKGEKWAYWNHSKKRFVVWRGKAPHGAEVILKFKRSFRGSRNAPAPVKQDAPPQTAPEGDDQPRVATIVPKHSPLPPREVGAEVIASGWSNGSRAGEPRLASPKLDPSPAINPLTSFPLAVRPIADDLPDGAVIMVSINGGTWEAFKGDPVSVQPGDDLLTFVSGDAVAGMEDSEPVGGRYEIDPVKLEISLHAPAKSLPAATFSPGTEREELFPNVLVKNFDGLPTNARDRSSFEILWTIDGSDPADSDTAFPVLFEDEAGKPHPLPMVVASLLGRPDELHIRAIARSKDTRVLAHSDEVSVTVQVAR